MTADAPRTAPWRVVILAFDGVEALDFAGPFEVFTTATRMHQRLHPAAPALFDVTSAAQRPHALHPVQARAGLRLLADHALDEAPRADVLIVPGGVVDAPLASPDTLGWIASQAASARITASVCTGAFLLAASGLLTSDRVTTHWEDVADLRAGFPALQVVEGVRWVDNGRVLSSAGISAGIDMSLHIVERLAGRTLAERTARQMDFTWTQNA
ncbi:DJ-1/PfpI family protein [Variovorax ginsengisoli]|uniref:Transcriptional regulator GlxA family with amidase domain n=1 Tax=Variovorax ginsengisoli TaxID=363844 RepID=A0ABT9S147_9BURK|nr:DJ-1/PfpI family protein [Variovorax ginsengisoli]MDP9898074.1 transcriptional regulator GlxA family with amidase domain [Variovorax ginsengisoli]